MIYVQPRRTCTGTGTLLTTSTQEMNWIRLIHSSLINRALKLHKSEEEKHPLQHLRTPIERKIRAFHIHVCLRYVPSQFASWIYIHLRTNSISKSNPKSASIQKLIQAWTDSMHLAITFVTASLTSDWPTLTTQRTKKKVTRTLFVVDSFFEFWCFLIFLCFVFFVVRS